MAIVDKSMDNMLVQPDHHPCPYLLGSSWYLEGNLLEGVACLLSGRGEDSCSLVPYLDICLGSSGYLEGNLLEGVACLLSRRGEDSCSLVPESCLPPPPSKLWPRYAAW